MKKIAFGLFAVAGLATSAMAQNSGATLTDGTAFYQVTSAGAAGTIPLTEPGGTALGAQANFSMGPLVTTQDQMYLNWMWYRINGTSTRELGIRQAAGTAVKYTSGTNSVIYQITPAAGLLFTLQFTLTDLDGAANEAANILMSTTFTNNTAAEVNMTLMNMADLFLFGADAADRLRSASIVGGNRNLLVSDSGALAAANATMMFTGYGAAGYGIGTFSGISGQVTDTGLDNFADINAGAPVEPAAGADISAVMQWNLGSIAPGASATVYSAIAVHLNGTEPQIGQAVQATVK